jgi:hypothetical protein
VSTQFALACVASILAAILVAHLLNYILKVLLNKDIRDALIPLLEFFVVVVVGVSAAHTLFLPAQGNDSAAWWNNPVWLATIILVLLVAFTALSISLYILDKRFGRG